MSPGRFVVTGKFHMPGSCLVSPGDVVELTDPCVISDLLNRLKIEPDTSTAKRLQSQANATWEDVKVSPDNRPNFVRDGILR
jgi:hypothetical protein